MSYKCPKCESQLEYWEEFIITKRRKVNKSNGKLNKKTTISKECDTTTSGLTCVDESCNFEYYGSGDKEEFIELEYLFDIIDTQLKGEDGK